LSEPENGAVNMAEGSGIKLTCDVGGTFTDVVLSDGDGRVVIGKALTTPRRLLDGLLDAVDAAGSQLDLSPPEVLKRCDLFVYSTTQATNAIVEKRTARTALLCTEGFPDILGRREGGSMHLYDFARPFPAPYVPRHLTFEIRERIGAEGDVVIPLDVDHAASVLKLIKAAQVEAVAVALLWSIANPSHETRLGDMVAKELPEVPYTLSHQLNPIIREYRRTSGTAIDASLKPLMQMHLREIEDGLRDAGLAGELVAASSFGGVLPMDHLIERPIFAVRSGPALAPVAGRLYSEKELGNADVIVCDSGGTSFDVSVIRDGGIVFARETWLGAPFEGHMTGLASVDVRSIGAGGGSIAWLDSGRLLRVGPDSAGADPGPACYGRGGEAPTVTDAAVVLGYIDPAHFLGGAMALDVTASERVIDRLALQMGVERDEAASGILALANELMVAAIKEITVNEGIDPRDSAVIAGGGAAGLNIAAIATELECPRVLIPRTAGALSAFGGQHSDIVLESGRTAFSSSDAFAFDEVRLAFWAIEQELNEFAATLGSRIKGQGRIDWFVEARYANQAWTLEVPLPDRGIADDEAVNRFVKSFDALHERVFAVHDPGQVVEILYCRGRLLVVRPKPPLRDLADGTGGSDGRIRRSAYFRGIGRLDAPLVEGASLKFQDRVEGPALITDPTTTVVVPPGAELSVTSIGNYLVELE
jgi:N-methylhydantoinase A